MRRSMLALLPLQACRRRDERRPASGRGEGGDRQVLAKPGQPRRRIVNRAALCNTGVPRFSAAAASSGWMDTVAGRSAAVCHRRHIG